MRAITLDEAVKIINETFVEAKRRNAYPLTAVLLDAGGRMKACMKQDGASLLRFEVSYGKAYAALANRGMFRPLAVIRDFRPQHSQRRAVSEPVSALIGNILADADARQLSSCETGSYCAGWTD